MDVIDAANIVTWKLNSDRGGDEGGGYSYRVKGGLYTKAVALAAILDASLLGD